MSIVKMRIRIAAVVLLSQTVVFGSASLASGQPPDNETTNTVSVDWIAYCTEQKSFYEQYPWFGAIFNDVSELPLESYPPKFWGAEIDGLSVPVPNVAYTRYRFTYHENWLRVWLDVNDNSMFVFTIKNSSDYQVAVGARAEIGLKSTGSKPIRHQVNYETLVQRSLHLSPSDIVCLENTEDSDAYIIELLYYKRGLMSADVAPSDTKIYELTGNGREGHVMLNLSNSTKRFFWAGAYVDTDYNMTWAFFFPKSELEKYNNLGLGLLVASDSPPPDWWNMIAKHINDVQESGVYGDYSGDLVPK